MKVDTIITRIKSQDSGDYWGATDAKRVTGAGDLSAVDENIENLPALPAAYVLPIEDTTDADSFEVGQQTLIEERFAVLAVLDNADDPRGHGAAEEIEDARDNLLAALVGWEASSSYTAVSYVGGSLVTFDRVYFLWVFHFQVTRRF